MRYLLTFILLLAAGFASAAEKPNILLIMADDVGCDALGCYGGESFATPHLDRLAESGMMYDHCYSMPVCHPTRVCLLTGRYPFRLNHPGWGSFPKSAEKKTVAHVLKESGYATAIAGKWQLTLMKNDLDHAERLGFEQSCLFGWHEGPRYHDPLIYQNGKMRTGTKGKYGPDLYTDFLIDFMTENRERPFFAFYSMALCHDVTDDLKEPVPFAKDGRYLNYQEMVESMDYQIGKLVAALDRLELRKETVILFTGDNGTPKSYIATARDGKYIREPIVMQARGKTVRGGKGDLTDAGTNVPLLASWPGTVPAGKRTDGLVDFSDFLPTCAELAGAELPNDLAIDGQSFASQLSDGSGSGRKWAFAEHRGKHWVRTQRWKLYDDGRLFDMSNDKLEKSPVAIDDSEAAESRKKLRQTMEQLTDS